MCNCYNTLICIVAFTSDPIIVIIGPTGPQRTVSQREAFGSKLTINISLLHEYTVKTPAADFTLDLVSFSENYATN